MHIRDTQQFEADLKTWNITLTNHQIEQFILYYDLLVEWNTVMNLTAITDYDEVLKKHFLDSISIVHYFEANEKYKGLLMEEINAGKYKLIDVGTGAGFPGIPIKILFPEIEIVLLDSIQKRVNFLNEVISKLSLEGITAIHMRAEDAGQQNEYREKFDLAVSRAVSNLSTLSEYCLPFVKIGGSFISYKSVGLKEELESAKKAINILGGAIGETKDFVLPNSEINRSLCEIKKIKAMAKKYPRKAGLPSKEPL